MSFLHALPASLIKVVNVLGTIQLERDRERERQNVALREVKERLSIASDPTNLSRITDMGLNLKIKMRNCFYRS